MKQKRLERRVVDGVLLLDKPLGLTSNTALQRVKRVFNAERVGHTGSLDPLATGLLPLCFGQATKLCGFLLDGDKRYRATLKLGAKTLTGDAEGEIIATSDPARADAESIERARLSMIGVIRQVPPMHSAIKIQGQKLYTLARQGIDIPRPPREVSIRSLELLRRVDDLIEFEVLCSKGTYVRTLAEDWAAAFGQAAHLVALRRTGAAPFLNPQMIDLAQIEGGLHHPEQLNRCLLPVASAVADWPQCTVGSADRARLRHGHPVSCDPAMTGACAVFDEAGRLLCLGEGDGHGQVQPRRWLGDEAE